MKLFEGIGVDVNDNGGEWPMDTRIGPWRLLQWCGLTVRVKHVWADAWIGVFVKSEKYDGYTKEVAIYICLFPFFPIIVSWYWSWRYEGWR